IDREYIENLPETAKQADDGAINAALDKAENFEGLNHREIAALSARPMTFRSYRSRTTERYTQPTVASR
ncbi:MAG: hypothetical protein LBO04_04645, partial [Spirochaetaceae bacterium]|nr:hypothetical protein [Spirochaetaceae bacterium]